MKEQIILTKILKMLIDKKLDYDYIHSNHKELVTYKNKYPFIDWDFLDDIENKSAEEISVWVDVCLKNVYIL